MERRNDDSDRLRRGEYVVTNWPVNAINHEGKRVSPEQAAQNELVGNRRFINTRVLQGPVIPVGALYTEHVRSHPEKYQAIVGTPIKLRQS